MSLTEAPSAALFDRRAARAAALVALAGVLVLEVTAVRLGRADHYFGLQFGTVFLLWRVWRGGRWSLALLRFAAILGAGLAVAMTVGAWAGSPGLVIPTLWAALLFAATGPLLFSPPIESLRRRGRPA